MTVNQTGNQFVLPNLPSDPEELVRWQTLVRFLNTQVVNRVVNASSSQPVLGIAGTGLVTAGGTITEIDSPFDSVDITNPNGPTVDIDTLLLPVGQDQVAHTPSFLSAPLVNIADVVSLLVVGILTGLTIGPPSVFLTFNADNSAVYDWQSITNNNGTVAGAVSASDTSINGMLPDSNNTGGSLGFNVAFSGIIPMVGGQSFWAKGGYPPGFYPNITLSWATFGNPALGGVDGNGTLSGQRKDQSTLTSIDINRFSGTPPDVGSEIVVYGLR